MILRKECSFSYGHMLPNQTMPNGRPGKCRNSHGHNCKMIVRVEGDPHFQEDTSQDGMLVDFGDLKQTINHVLVDRLDHMFLYNDGREWPVAALHVCEWADTCGYEMPTETRNNLDLVIKALPWKGTLHIGLPTTAEMLSLWAFDQLNAAMLAGDPPHLNFLRLLDITWYETPTSYARCDRDTWGRADRAGRLNYMRIKVVA